MMRSDERKGGKERGDKGSEFSKVPECGRRGKERKHVRFKVEPQVCVHTLYAVWQISISHHCSNTVVKPIILQ